MGVWIETLMVQRLSVLILSHPVWVCGLKHEIELFVDFGNRVTPCMGVWIETMFARSLSLDHGRHTLYGCVD